MDVISDFEEIITRLGGRVAVQEMFGVGQPAVSMWKARGFPDRRSFSDRLDAEAEARGFRVDARLYAVRKAS